MQLHSVYNFTFLKTFITSYHTALPTAIDIDIGILYVRERGWLGEPPGYTFNNHNHTSK